MHIKYGLQLRAEGEIHTQHCSHLVQTMLAQLNTHNSF